MKQLEEKLSELEVAILVLLSYYEIFKHPLRRSEITERIGLKGAGASQTKEALDRLMDEGIIFKSKSYYSLQDRPAAISKREEGELRAIRLMKIAKFMSRLIYAFPFVRGVFISGSLSKGSVPEDADIDFFIVTKKNRLWLPRTMLVLFKRLFLLNSKKYFCTNYFVDEQTMEIPDKNVFTATEVSTLIPMRGISYYHRFIEANIWFRDFYPNLILPEAANDQPSLVKGISKNIIEKLFFHSLAEKLEKSFMKKTYQRWMTMYGGNYSNQEFEIAFRSNRGTSKNHDKNYQSRVLSTLEKNVKMATQRLKTEEVHG